MASRSSAGIVTQIGVETTENVATPANKKFPSLQISLKNELGTRFYRAAGDKTPSIGVLNTLSSTGSFSGGFVYAELTYLLASYTHLASTTVIGATTGYTHVFSPTATGTDTNKTLTIQRGDSTAAQQATGCIVNSLQLALTRQECTVSGGIIGRDFTNGATLTATPTLLAQVPASGNTLSVYLDSTFGGLGATKITDCFRANINLPEKYRPKWVIDSAQTSWKEGVEVPTEPTVVLACEYNAQMQAIYDALVTNTLPTRYLRVESVGPNIGTAADYKAQFNFAVKIKDATPEEDLEGIVHGYTFEFQVVNDSTMARPWSAVTVDKLAAVT